jgi:D-hydroxyproline dehydrogenase subunit gamma
MSDGKQDLVSIRINGRAMQVPDGISIAVALALADEPCRISVSHQERGPLCAMGICYECRVTIDGIAGRLACQTFCVAGMKVDTCG